ASVENPEPSSQNRLPAAQNEELPVDMERLWEFSNDGDNFNEIISLYLKQTSEQLRQIHDAIEAKLPAKVASVAHSCAGASATCGMVVIVPWLRQLEEAGKQGALGQAAE